MKPTIGRIVHIRISDVLQPAIVVKVWNDTCLNVVSWNEGGTQTFHSSTIQGDSNGQWRWPARD
jgi:hypothetical protein